MTGLMTDCLRAHPQGSKIARILEAALHSVEPGEALRRNLRIQQGCLLAGEFIIDLKDVQHIWLVGAGKAAYPMTQAALELLGERVSGGLVIVKEGHGGELPASCPVRLVEAGHPVPDQRGAQAARDMAALLKGLSASDLVLCLISGGGSALLASPAEGITLDDLQVMTNQLLRCGAPVHEINILRKHLETLKGGGLARLAAPARLVSLVLSDVIGDPLESIASGPTVADPSTFQQAVAILEQYQIAALAPPAIRARLQRGLQGQIPETPKPGDALFQNVHNLIVGSNILAVQAALEKARQEGFTPLLLTTSLQGEARLAGRFLASIARQETETGQPVARPACIAAGGETTVTVTGEGRGGRNQELALGAVCDLAGLPDTFLVALASDGGDGPTDAAGAIASGTSLERARRQGLDPAVFLKNNNAYAFFDALGDLIRTGPTQTNVNDLALIFIF